VELESGPPGRSAFDLWLSKPENAGKTYADYETTQRGPKGETGDQGPPGDTTAADALAAEAAESAATSKSLANTSSAAATAAALSASQAAALAAAANIAIENGDAYARRNKADLPVEANASGETEFGYVFADSEKDDNNGRYYREAGETVWNKVPGDLTGRMLRQESKTSPFSIVENFEYGGEAYSVGFFDPFLRFAGGMTATGQLKLIAAVIAPFAPSLVTALAEKANATELTTLQEQVAPLSGQFKFRTDRPGFLFTIEDESFPFSRYCFAVKDTGETIIPGLAIPGADPGSITTVQLADASVTKPKLDPEIVRETAADRVDFQLDQYRPQHAQIFVRTGLGWVTLSPRKTSVLSGVNTSDASLDFRQSSGLFVRGQRYRGPFDPSVAPSINYLGGLTSESNWPPAGNFNEGDFYEFQAYSGTLTIGDDTMRRGDLMVYTGGAWVYRQAPGGYPNIWKDFWVANADGWFRGLEFKAGDRLVFMAYQPAGGGNMPSRWIKGGTDGEWFFRGEFDPADGFPENAIDGDLWEASAAGEVGGLSLTAGDEVIKTGGAWGPVARREVITVPAGGAIALPCTSAASEWEVRRTDKSETAAAIALDCRGVAVPSRSGYEIVMEGDSMPGKLNSSLKAALGDRTLTTRSYGGGQSQEVEAMIEYLAANDDPHTGKTFIFWQGENNASRLSQIAITAERLVASTGSSDGRFVHIGMPGRRTMSWNGERLVCSNEEQQLVPGSDNAYAKAREYFLTSWPNNYIDTRAVMAAAADDTP
ncbi:hypothetical protein JIN85_20225, partial [Luteolibacter pohnpeiensis]